MDCLVDFRITVLEATLARELKQRMTSEGARVVDLAAQGRASRVWSSLPVDRRWRAMGLFCAVDDDGLRAILGSLPLRPWMEIPVTALVEHPNYPAFSTPVAC